MGIRQTGTHCSLITFHRIAFPCAHPTHQHSRNSKSFHKVYKDYKNSFSVMVKHCVNNIFKNIYGFWKYLYNSKTILIYLYIFRFYHFNSVHMIYIITFLYILYLCISISVGTRACHFMITLNLVYYLNGLPNLK